LSGARPWRLRFRRDCHPAASAGLEPLFDRAVPDDPPAADQRGLQLAALDGTSDGPVLTSRQLSNFLDGQVRTAAHFRLPAQTLGPPMAGLVEKQPNTQRPTNVPLAPDGRTIALFRPTACDDAGRERGRDEEPQTTSTSAHVALAIDSRTAPMDRRARSCRRPDRRLPRDPPSGRDASRRRARRGRAAPRRLEGPTALIEAYVGGDCSEVD
jgi:hypothetical protein